LEFAENLPKIRQKSAELCYAENPLEKNSASQKSANEGG